MDDLPFSHVEDVGFMEVIAEGFQYKIKQRHYYKNLIYNMYPLTKETVLEKFNALINSKLSCTMNSWSDTLAGVSLMSLICHAVDSEFILFYVPNH